MKLSLLANAGITTSISAGVEVIVVVVRCPYLEQSLLIILVFLIQICSPQDVELF